MTASGVPAVARSGNFRGRLGASRHEGWFVEEIRRRITTNRQLRKHDDVRLGRACLPGKIDDFLCIPLEISYRGVDLGESDLHLSSLPTALSVTPASSIVLQENHAW